jgi:hypothetical protein
MNLEFTVVRTTEVATTGVPATAYNARSTANVSTNVPVVYGVYSSRTPYGAVWRAQTSGMDVSMDAALTAAPTKSYKTVLVAHVDGVRSSLARSRPCAHQPLRCADGAALPNK